MKNVNRSETGQEVERKSTRSIFCLGLILESVNRSTTSGSANRTIFFFAGLIQLFSSLNFCVIGQYFPGLCQIRPASLLGFVGAGHAVNEQQVNNYCK